MSRIVMLALAGAAIGLLSGGDGMRRVLLFGAIGGGAGFLWDQVAG